MTLCTSKIWIILFFFSFFSSLDLDKWCISASEIWKMSTLFKHEKVNLQVLVLVLEANLSCKWFTANFGPCWKNSNRIEILSQVRKISGNTQKKKWAIKRPKYRLMSTVGGKYQQTHYSFTKAFICKTV